MRPLCYALIAGWALAGCRQGGDAELKQWMATVQQQTHAAAPPAKPRAPFVPFAYRAASGADPFNPARLEARKAAPSNAVHQLELARDKELLEHYPLESIKMVGTLQMAGVRWALLQIEGRVYSVKTGQHIGQNFGLITSVNESALTLREIVAAAGGAWIERSAALGLQDSASGESKK